MDKKILILAFVLVIAIGLFVQLVFAKPTPRAAPECKDGIDNDSDGNTDWPSDTGCQNKNDKDESDCGDGVCEGEETEENCPADCAEPDSCSDTDGGLNIFVQGLVSGYQSENPYNYTDYCLNNATLKEYYCSGTSPLNFDYPCSANATVCINGACV